MVGKVRTEDMCGVVMSYRKVRRSAYILVGEMGIALGGGDAGMAELVADGVESSLLITAWEANVCRQS